MHFHMMSVTVLLRDAMLLGRTKYNLGTILLQGSHNPAVTLELKCLFKPQVYYHDAHGLFLSRVPPFARLPLTYQ